MYILQECRLPAVSMTLRCYILTVNDLGSLLNPSSLHPSQDSQPACICFDPAISFGLYDLEKLVHDCHQISEASSVAFLPNLPRNQCKQGVQSRALFTVLEGTQPPPPKSRVCNKYLWISNISIRAISSIWKLPFGQVDGWYMHVVPFFSSTMWVYKLWFILEVTPFAYLSPPVPITKGGKKKRDKEFARPTLPSQRWRAIYS
jgi:hypothetical protein